jgi:hypothetical protein
MATTDANGTYEFSYGVGTWTFVVKDSANKYLGLIEGADIVKDVTTDNGATTITKEVEDGDGDDDEDEGVSMGVFYGLVVVVIILIILLIMMAMRGGGSAPAPPEEPEEE